MKDLVVPVADKNMEAAVRTLIEERHKSFGHSPSASRYFRSPG